MYAQGYGSQAVFIDVDNPPMKVATHPSYEEHEQWIKACTKELREQVNMNAFSVCERHEIPPRTLVLKSGWRLLRKRDPKTNEIVKYKARAFIKIQSSSRRAFLRDDLTYVEARHDENDASGSSGIWVGDEAI